MVGPNQKSDRLDLPLLLPLLLPLPLRPFYLRHYRAGKTRNLTATFLTSHAIRLTTLLNSLSHKTELAITIHRTQSSQLRLTVEKARWRKGR